jgi:hypothetical protein
MLVAVPGSTPMIRCYSLFAILFLSATSIVLAQMTHLFMPFVHDGSGGGAFSEAVADVYGQQFPGSAAEVTAMEHFSQR